MSVYFIQAVNGGPIKIGYSKDVNGCHKRLKDLQHANPERLRITKILPEATRDHEQALHREFRAWRMAGEWFRPVYAVAIEAGALPADLEAAWHDGYSFGFTEGYAACDELRADQQSPWQREAEGLRRTAMAQGSLLRDLFLALPVDFPGYEDLWTLAVRRLPNTPGWLGEVEPRARRGQQPDLGGPLNLMDSHLDRIGAAA